MNDYFERIGLWSSNIAESVWAYVIGFVLSALCTLSAYWLVTTHVASGHVYPSHHVVFIGIGVFALVQFVVQLICFFHLDLRKRSTQRLIALGSSIVVIFIIFIGSIWIMQTLNVRMMLDPGAQMQYMNDQQG